MAFEKSKSRQDTNLMFGRHEISVSVKEEELNEVVIADILKTALPVHLKNVRDIQYLKSYKTGKQDILYKTKKVRPEINNIVVENNAFHVVEFKKGYVFGDPIQYVQRLDADDDELSKLNQYMIENNKSALDKDLADDFYTFATGFRIILPHYEERKPFILANLNADNTFVVYSTDVFHTKLMGCYMTQKSDKEYEIMVYTKNGVYYYEWKKNNSTKDNIQVVLIGSEPNPLRKIPIVEYKLNKSRLGLVELIKSQLDTLNKITSADIDDIDQFVQSLLVFINQDITKDEFIDMIDMGAVMLSDSVGTNVKADLKLLSQKLAHTETKVLYQRIYEEMLTIAGVPKMSDRSSGGDTGLARMAGEGWIMADDRAKQDELAFKMAEREMLDIALDICKVKSNSGIKKLSVSDLDIKFTRNKSDNMLVKTQSLVNLKNAKVPPEVAFAVVGLFSDPNEVVKQARAYYGDDFWKDDEIVKEVAQEFSQPIE